jgi:AraC family transcriptional regulator
VQYEKGLPTWVAMRLYREFQNRDNLTVLMLEGLLLELLAVSSRHNADRAEVTVPRWLREARDLLHARFTEQMSLDEIATSVGVHPSHLSESFRQHYRCTVGDYVRQLRVEYATHLLSASNLPASQIAFTAGFADQSHFSRTFRRLTGMTPTEFKKAMR